MKKKFCLIVMVIASNYAWSQCGPFLGGDKVVIPCSLVNLNDLFQTNATIQTTSLTPTDTIRGNNGVDSVVFYQSKTKVIATRSDGCKDSAVVRTIGLREPIPQLGADITKKICSGKTIDITPFYNTGSFAVEWDTPVPADVGIGKYKLTITSRDGCKDDAIITIDSFPKPRLGRDSTLTIRFEDSVNLFTLYNTTGLELAWNTINPASAKRGIYELIATNNNGCKDTAYTIVKNHPKPNLGPDQNICTKNPANLTTLFSLTGLTVSWSTPNPAAAAPGIYTVVVTNQFNSKDTAKVTVHNNDMPELPTQTIQKCLNEFINITIYFDLAGLTTIWNTPDAESVKEPGIYNVIATNLIGCKREGTILVELNPLPPIKDTTVIICGANTKNLNEVYNTTGYSSVNWSTPNPEAAMPGTYTISFTDEFGCDLSYTATIVSKSSIASPLSICAVYTSSNSALSTNAMRTVIVDKNNNVWAGADGGGLYRFTRSGNTCVGTWQKSNQYSPVATYKDLLAINFQDVCQCSSGDIGLWSASTGHSALQAITGGVFHVKDDAFTTQRFGSVDDVGENGNLSSRFANSITVGLNNKVYVALGQSLKTSNNAIMEGGVFSYDLNSSATNFTKIENLSLPEKDIKVTATGRRGDEVWFAVDRSCILNGGCNAGFIARYNTSSETQTGAIRFPLPFTSDGGSPVVRSIFTDSIGRTYVGMSAGKGFAVLDTNNTWKLISSQNSLLPAGASINFNAITQVNNEIWIGTTNGLLVFNGAGQLDDCASYALYGTAQNLPGNNVTDIAYDTSRLEVWVTTNAGICLLQKSTSVTGTILDVSCGKYEEVSSVFIRIPIKGARVSLRELDGSLVDQAITDDSGSFSLENGVPSKKYKVTIEYLNKYKYEYSNIDFDKFLGDVLIPDSLIKELNLFSPVLKTKKFDFTFFKITSKDSIAANGYDTTGFYRSYLPFISTTIKDNHKKMVDDLASFYATTATMYQFGNSSNDLYKEMLKSFVEVGKLIFEVTGISKVLSNEKLSGGALQSGQNFSASDITRAQVEKLGTYTAAIEGVYKRLSEKYVTDPKNKANLDLGFEAVKTIIEFCSNAIVNGLEGNFQTLINKLVEEIVTNLIQKGAALQYERFCNTRHKNFITNAAQESFLHTNAFDYETIHKQMYSLVQNGMPGLNSINKKRADSVAIIMGKINFLISVGETAEEIKSYTDLLALLSAASVIGAELAPIFMAVSKVAEAAKISSTLVIPVYAISGYNTIDDMSDRVGPLSGFGNLQRLANHEPQVNYKLRPFNVSGNLQNYKILFNQGLTSFKTVVNLPYDSVEFSNKLNDLLNQKKLYENEIKVNLDPVYPHSGYANTNIAGFENNFSITVDSFLARQGQDMFALLLQIQSYMLDSSRARRVPGMNRLIDKIKILNDSAVNRIGAVLDQLDGASLPETARLEKESFKIFYNNQRSSIGKLVYEFINTGNTGFYNVGIKISPATAGFQLISTDSVYIGSIQPGEKKQLVIFFTSPPVDSIGNINIVIKNDTTVILNSNTLLVCRQLVNNDIAVTIKNGNWSNSSTWNTGKVPSATTSVTIKHPVIVDIDANCKSLRVEVPGNIIVNAGKTLKILQ